MHKYGIIENGKLKIVTANRAGAKPVKYAQIPEFDQLTQAVFAGQAVDMGEYIFVDVEIREVEPEDGEFDETLMLGSVT